MMKCPKCNRDVTHLTKTGECIVCYSKSPKWQGWIGGHCRTCGLQANRCECVKP